jgi:hypothetical protein
VLLGPLVAALLAVPGVGEVEVVVTGARLFVRPTKGMTR